MLRFVLGFSILILISACGKKEELSQLSQMFIPDPPKTVSIEINNYCVQPTARYANFYVSSESYMLQKEKLEIDEDWDGVPNIEDNNNTLNIRYDRRDSNADGYNDLLMYLSGIRASTQQALRRCPMARADQDLDGLSDCEEQYLLFTDETKFDSDGDLIPDLLELRRGLNPRDPADALLDPDNDGFPSIEEVARGTPINVSNSEFVEMYAIKTVVRPIDNQPGCYNIKVSNLPVVDTVRGNLIRFYFIEEQPVAGGGGQMVFLLQNKVLPASLRGVIDRGVEDKTKYVFDFSQLANGATVN